VGAEPVEEEPVVQRFDRSGREVSKLLIALKSRSAAASDSGGLIFFPLLFLTPNFVPRDLLTRPVWLNVRLIRQYD
jgi:hypothetical protein